jgi:hypothetical protein
MLTRLRQLAAKIETQEGIAEALAALDAKLLVYDPKVNYDIPMFVRNPVRDSFSKVGKIAGMRPAGISFRLVLRGSGIATTEPEWGKLIRACNFEINSLYSINIGAITSGPFEHGETITGGTSGATGRVVIETQDGAAKIYFVPIAGVFVDLDVITGETSGASTTASSAPVEEGKEIKPISKGASSLTFGSYEDEIRKLIKGARGKVKFTLKAGEPAMLDFEYMGVEAGIIDTSLLSGIQYEDTKPPVFLNAALSIDNVAAKLSELEIDFANVLSPRDDVSDQSGILSYQIVDRDVVGSFNPEMMSVVSHDFHSKWFDNAEMVLDFVVGSASGNKFRFYAPRVQYNKVDDEDKEGIAIARTSFDLNGILNQPNSELCILAL